MTEQVVATTYTGATWQEHINRLCHTQCQMNGEAYQPVPDRVHGDGGLEGVTSAGDGFQCYVDEDTQNTNERTRKQKAKITADLPKLKTNAAFWADFLDLIKLRRWFLVVPDMPDKTVVTHARKHARKIREANLPFIDTAFEAYVVSDEHFQQAKEWSARMGATTLNYSPDPPPPNAVDVVGSKFVADTERKLRQVRPTDTDVQIQEQRDKYLNWHLGSQNVMSKLLAEVPQLYESVQISLSGQKHKVEFENTVDELRPSRRLKGVRDDLAACLNRDYKMLGTGTIDVISIGTIAGWMGECSLQFTEGNDDGRRER